MRKKIDSFCKQHGVKKSQIAKSIGVTPQAFSNKLNDNRFTVAEEVAINALWLDNERYRAKVTQVDILVGKEVKSSYSVNIALTDAIKLFSCVTTYENKRIAEVTTDSDRLEVYLEE